MKESLMVIENRKTDGAQPVKVFLSSDGMYLVIRWNECDMKISTANNFLISVGYIF